MNHINSESRLMEIIGNKFGLDPRKISPNTLFYKDLGADVVDLIELVMRIEEEFDLDIPDEKVDRMKTVGQMVKYVNSKLKTLH